MRRRIPEPGIHKQENGLFIYVFREKKMRHYKRELGYCALYMSYAMADEFARLCDLADSKGFCESAELSRFIVVNQLGLEFQHLSGVLPMEREDGYVFDFVGGIHPYYYGALCDWLQLTSQGTRTRPIEEEFIPYSELF